MHTISGTTSDDTIFGDQSVNGVLDTIDFIYGLDGNDVLHGLTDSDFLSGGNGNDSLTGGTGADTFSIEDIPFDIALAFHDTIADFSLADGDLLDVSALGISDFATVERLLFDLGTDLELTFSRNGLDQKTILVGVADLTSLTPSKFVFSSLNTNDTITGSLSRDDLFGGLGDDNLDGSVENDRLFGEAGIDSLAGGSGDDELYGGTGNDGLFGQFGFDRLYGGDGDDLLNGDFGPEFHITESDILIGGAGLDTLNGGAGNDTLEGGDGADILRGGLDTDALTGGEGADLFVFEDLPPLEAIMDSDDIISDFSLADGDLLDLRSLGISELSTVQQLLFNGGLSFMRNGYIQVTELLGVADTPALPGNAFFFSSAISDDNVTGSEFADDLFGGLGNDIIDGSGDNDRLFGEAGHDSLLAGYGDDSLWAAAGDDQLFGDYGVDVLSGGLDNDLIDGGFGDDSMAGGLGNDTYIIDSAADTISEFNGIAEGIDLVRSSLTLSLTALLAIENLELTGTANINGTGNSSDNSIIGNDGNNSISAGDGNDTLTGGTGTDILRGSLGDDLYFVDAQGEAREGLNQGTDTVQSSVTYSLAGNIENLTLTGTADINGTGNSIANTLTGNTGNNLLNAFGGGTDTLIGGTGDDVYRVDTADIVTELAGGGSDTVRTTQSYTLGAELEKLVLEGTANTHGTGNTLDNTITGNTGNNTLTGGLGRDFLTGGTGTDRFDFNALAESGITGPTRDVITDFEAGTALTTIDRIDLATIDGIPGGANNAFVFVAGGGAFTAAGQVRAIQSGANTLVQMNTDGNFTTIEMVIQLTNVTATNINAGDFVL